MQSLLLIEFFGLDSVGIQEVRLDKGGNNPSEDYSVLKGQNNGISSIGNKAFSISAVNTG